MPLLIKEEQKPFFCRPHILPNHPYNYIEQGSEFLMHLDTVLEILCFILQVLLHQKLFWKSPPIPCGNQVGYLDVEDTGSGTLPEAIHDFFTPSIIFNVQILTSLCLPVLIFGNPNRHLQNLIYLILSFCPALVSFFYPPF